MDRRGSRADTRACLERGGSLRADSTRIDADGNPPPADPDLQPSGGPAHGLSGGRVATGTICAGGRGSPSTGLAGAQLYIAVGSGGAIHTELPLDDRHRSARSD